MLRGLNLFSRDILVCGIPVFLIRSYNLFLIGLIIGFVRPPNLFAIGLIILGLVIFYDIGLTNLRISIGLITFCLMIFGLMIPARG